MKETDKDRRCFGLPDRQGLHLRLCSSRQASLDVAADFARVDSLAVQLDLAIFSAEVDPSAV
jgi:hypothetical protein